MHTNLFDQHYIGQLINQCWRKTLSLIPEDKNNVESRKFCCNSKNTERKRNSDNSALRYLGLFRRHCIR